MKDKKWLRLLAYVTGLVNQELLSGTSTWRRKTGSGGHTCRRDSGFPMGRGPLWPGSVSDSDGRKALAQVACVASQTQSRPGTGG